MRIALAARDPRKLATLAAETNATAYACDVSKADDVAHLFAQLDGPPDVVVFNPSARARGPVADLIPHEVERAIAISAFGGFLVGQAAVRAMLPRGSGTIIFTGASASVKGYPLSAPFAMGKFALRGLAQSMARELAPKGIHIAHVVIDGGIRSAGRQDPPDAPDSLLDPDAIAETYLHLVNQPRTAWTWEIEVRPWVERF
jgi:NAD(P)-dependent dehydrogenase (short-subunit alcohol dehydrogenase family)